MKEETCRFCGREDAVSICDTCATILCSACLDYLCRCPTCAIEGK